MTESISIAEFSGLAGTDLAPSEWLEISQERVNRFADATNDHQFIHVDVEKAKETAFGCAASTLSSRRRYVFAFL